MIQHGNVIKTNMKPEVGKYYRRLNNEVMILFTVIFIQKDDSIITEISNEQFSYQMNNYIK